MRPTPTLHRPQPAAEPLTRVHAAPRCSLALAALLAVTFLAAPPIRAQQDSVLHEEGRTPRAKSYGLLGFVIGTAAGFGIAETQNPPAYSVAAAGAVLGTLGGWLIGRQYDEIHRAQFRGVRPITPRNSYVEIEGEPTALATQDTLVAVGGTDGVQLYFSGASLLPLGTRAAGLIGIGAIAVTPTSQWLTVGSGNGLYIYPPHRGRGILVQEGSVASVVASAGRIFAATGDRVTITPVDADSSQLWPGTSLGAPVRALALDSARAIVWAVTDEQLIALRVIGDSLARIGTAPIEGGVARRVAYFDDRVAVAVGGGGVRLYNVSDPTKPKGGHAWTVARFAYDVSLDGERMFVAAGPEGVYVAEFRHGSVITIGLARGLGFASAIVSRDGYTYLLDRRTNLLRRIRTDF